MKQSLARALVRAAWVGLVTVGVVACGGGGGGGGDSGPPPQVPGDVSIVVSTATVTAVAQRGTAARNVTLSGYAMGNVARLANRTIYIVVEDPAGRFDPAPVSVTTNGSASLNLTLATRAIDTVGSYTGTLTVRVCLDAACRSQLLGSPAQVGYTLRVVPLTQFSQASLNVNATFGEPAIKRTVTLQLGGRMASYGWGGVAGRPFEVENKTPAGATDYETFEFTFYPREPGVFTHSFRLEGEGEVDGVRYPVDVTLPIRYETADNPAVDYVFSVPSLAFNTWPGGTSNVDGSLTFDFWIVTRAGVTATWRGMEYLTHPPEADGLAPATSWWDETLRGVRRCGPTPPYGYEVCLPNGTYTARGHYTITKNGVNTEVYFPLTMNVLSQQP